MICILTPLYNTPPKYLERFLDSVQGQTCGSWQLCLTQEPTGVNGYDWCAVFAAQAVDGPWNYQAKQPDPASR